jgi:AraC-like DNA-binding protein
LFENVYGKSLYDYFTEKKMQKAKDVLLLTDKNIAEIAYEFGFANPSNFSAAFKKYFNKSPNGYRMQYKLTAI